MDTTQAGTFGDLLRRYRVEAGLTQEALAERAGLSVRAITDLERGARRAPYPDTVQRLAKALRLGAVEREALGAAARSPRMTAAVRGALAGPPTRVMPAPPPFVVPVPPTPLIGREADVAEVCARLLHAGGRLLTLTGPGGVGKTRLALEVAARLRGDFVDGVYFVPLEAIRDPALVDTAIARTLGVRQSGGRSLRDLLVACLADRHLLLVLDNCEQVLGAAPLVADLLAACPRLTALATSRVPLRLRAEQVVGVPPLALPGPAQVHDADAVLRAPAVALFVDRAHAASARFQLTPEQTGAVAELCTRLDGLPLAIELVATRVRVLSPHAILDRLDRHLRLLGDGARDLPARHQTLRDTIAWSCDLLTPAEQRLFGRLAVFVGGCTLEAAEAVCHAAGDPAADVLEQLASLVDHNLVHREDGPDGEPRFGMLEMTREYALEQLEASGEAAAICRRHAAFFLALAERAEPELTGPAQGAWLVRLEADHPNLRAALTWAREQDDPEHELRLVGALAQFWYLHSHLSEGRGWLDGALRRAEAMCGSGAGEPARRRAAIRARLLTGAGVLRHAQGDHAAACARLEQGVALWRQAGEKRQLAHALLWLGWTRDGAELPPVPALGEESLALCREAGDNWGVGESSHYLGHQALQAEEAAAARALFEHSLATFRQVGNRWSIAAVLKDLAWIAHWHGDYAPAGLLLEESLALHRQVGDRWHIARTLARLGELRQLEGDDERAATCYGESLALGRALGHRGLIAGGLHNLGQLALCKGDVHRARGLFVESLALYRQMEGEAGYMRGIGLCLAGLAGVAAAEGRPERAARLSGAASRCEPDRERAGINRFDRIAYAVGHDDRVAAVRGALGEEPFAAAWAEGQAMSLEAAIVEALSDPVPR